MLLKKGIVRKTFVFSALLITLVTLISFAILYFIMPWFYQFKKVQTFEKNLDSLVTQLKQTQTLDEYTAIIGDFSDANNANVLSFDSDGMMLSTVSTPFIAMQGTTDTFFSVTQESGMVEAKFGYPVTINQRIGGRVGSSPVLKNEAHIGIRLISDVSDNILSMRGEIGTPIVDYIIINGSLQPIDEARGVILSLIPYVLFVGIVIGLFLSWIYARQISKPILQISDAAVKMQQMKPDANSGIRSKDELGVLSRNLDDLYASLLKNIDGLKREMDKANRLERSKTEMMQSASHELKTPIAALGGMVEGMIDNVGAYKNKDKYLHECKGQIEKLSALVSEILSASKSDAFEDDLEPEEVSVDDLVSRSLEEHAVQIHENGLEVIAELAPVVIETDEAILYRAISNIISNAVRYTGKHGEIRIQMLEDEAGKRLAIKNPCDPIPEDEIARLFEPFYTRSYSRDKSKSGTGLGLYIVKRNLERLGIPYTVEYEGSGLKFSLELQASGLESYVE